MHATDLDIAVINNDEGCEHLANEFFYRGYYEYVIFETKKENDKSRGNKVLKFRILPEMKGEETAKDKTCKNTQASQWSDGSMMHFTRIGHIKKLFHFSYIYNSWYGKEGNGK
ncbi:MAG TPA: hypothetical protein VK541_25505 [Pedobacter sp.]|nr:hypothetical protein [Pedobacter sp.]